jgi:CBS domain-containing protein
MIEVVHGAAGSRATWGHRLGTCMRPCTTEDLMTMHESKPQAVKELLDALAVARGRARVQAHLLSLDAKKRWQGLESTLLELESKLEHNGEKIAAAVTANVREVTQAARDLMHELDGSLELSAPVRKLMNPEPRTCAPGDTLDRAAQLMWELDCGVVPVVDAQGAVVGIVTDRDLCMASYTRGEPLRATPVESTMSRSIIGCSPEDSVGHALRVMATNRVRRLPVIEQDRLVGLITLADISRAIRKQPGNRIPACVALADTVALICEERPAAERTQAAE